ncbi:hypothetical protein ASC76_22215 [Rhizobacter sp. Root404]|nr:hypothetical protein [Rhizobacter sp. Root404]KQW35707.1 hypothetical protein ASC76_22215 [Rhizobacter sp. Root404]
MRINEPIIQVACTVVPLERALQVTLLKERIPNIEVGANVLRVDREYGLICSNGAGCITPPEERIASIQMGPSEVRRDPHGLEVASHSTLGESGLIEPVAFINKRDRLRLT